MKGMEKTAPTEVMKVCTRYWSGCQNGNTGIMSISTGALAHRAILYITGVIFFLALLVSGPGTARADITVVTVVDLGLDTTMFWDIYDTGAHHWTGSTIGHFSVSMGSNPVADLGRRTLDVRSFINDVVELDSG